MLEKRNEGHTMPSESMKKAIAKYDAKNTTKVVMKLNLKTDADILARLEAVGNKQGYIKKLIREDMEKNGGCKE